MGGIKEFFQRFESNSRDGLDEALIEQFATVFLAGAEPLSVTVSASEFAKALPVRRKNLSAMGIGPGKLVEMKEVWIQGRYSLVETSWQVLLSGREDGVSVCSTFLVEETPKGYKVIFYLAHQNLLQIARQRRA